MDLNGTLSINRRLAMKVNPSPWMSLRFYVLRPLKLADEEAPEGVTAKDWKALLDHWDTDHSVGLQRGVFYLAGEVINVERFEAAELLTIAHAYFEPANEEATLLYNEIGGPS